MKVNLNVVAVDIATDTEFEYQGEKLTVKRVCILALLQQRGDDASAAFELALNLKLGPDEAELKAEDIVKIKSAFKTSIFTAGVTGFCARVLDGNLAGLENYITPAEG